MAKWRRQPFSGSHDPQQLDPEPLSRVTPVVMFFFAQREAAVQLASEAARTTCQAPAVLAACRALARALHAALSGQPKAAILALLQAVPVPKSAAVEPAAGESAPAALRRRLRSVCAARTISATRCWPPPIWAATRTSWRPSAGHWRERTTVQLPSPLSGATA